jgi:adenine-specific DNA-methyltransferase
MTSLAEKEGLKGKVQMIYLDPPYGIKFGSNWQVSTRKRDVKDGKAEDTTRQPEQVKAFRDTWQLGIHSYLAYLRDRLVTARELLSESGSLFIQISDENVHLVRSLLDEVFGSENFVSQIIFTKTSSATAENLATVNDYILWYGKSKGSLKFRPFYLKRQTPFEDPDSKYDQIQLSNYTRRALSFNERNGLNLVDDEARIYRLSGLDSTTGTINTRFKVEFEGRDFYPSGTGGWKSSAQGINRLILADRIQSSRTIINYIRYFDDYPYYPINNLWTDIGGAVQSRSDPKIYVVQTGTAPIQRCMLMATDPGDLVLDPTCGSGTTAYVAEQWGRRWITMDTSRVSIALARTRLMSGRYPYYLLADSAEGRRKEAELNPHIALSGAFSSEVEGQAGGDIRKGFVYERVPHVTLKSIANNEEIDDIHAKYQEQLEPLRAEINKLAKKKWEEWEIPRQPSEGSEPSESSRLIAKYWQLRSDRQRAIDATIARRADTEFLYDKPYQDNKRVRVSGPFTVESLSPHRVLTPDDPATPFKENALNTQDFTQMIIENLKASGVQNTIKNQRLKFERLEPYAGT